jgi:hypothetical protein
MVKYRLPVREDLGREKMASYMLITSLYNEEDNVDGLFDSVEGQVKPPDLWMIIDDGSTDETQRKLLKRSKSSGLNLRMWRGSRKPKPDYDTIGRAIRQALLTLDEGIYESFGYFCLLGADSRVRPEYFSEVIRRMENDPGMGMASGIVVTASGREETRSDIPRGSGSSTKARVWRSLPREDLPDFDIDAFYTAKTRIMGLETRRFADLEVFQTRPTTISNPYRKGQLMAIHRYNPIIVAAHSLRMLIRGGNPLSLVMGYARGLRGKRIEDDDIRAYFGRRIILDLLRNFLSRRI